MRPAVPIINQIWYAVKNGDLEEFKSLTKYGSKNPTFTWDNKNRTPLYLAAEFGHLDIIKYIAPFVSDINLEDSEG